MRIDRFIDRFHHFRSISIRMVPILFYTLTGCMVAGGVASSHQAVLTAPIRRLTRAVRVRLDQGANPSTLSRAYFWRVDEEGRIDLVTWVRPGSLDQTIRWVEQMHGRIIAQVHSAHEFEAWIPARIVLRLARKSAVQNIRFPHYAMLRH
ncbi:MAG: hypothetical protein ACYCS1_10715 [Gammaproteobacteria bacterium]